MYVSTNLGFISWWDHVNHVFFHNVLLDCWVVTEVPTLILPSTASTTTTTVTGSKPYHHLHPLLTCWTLGMLSWLKYVKPMLVSILRRGYGKCLIYLHVYNTILTNITMHVTYFLFIIWCKKGKLSFKNM